MLSEPLVDRRTLARVLTDPDPRMQESAAWAVFEALLAAAHPLDSRGLAVDGTHAERRLLGYLTELAAFERADTAGRRALFAAAAGLRERLSQEPAWADDLRPAPERIDGIDDLADRWRPPFLLDRCRWLSERGAERQGAGPGEL